MKPGMGTCEKHGEFILAEGCPQCLAERRAGPGGPGANTYGAKPKPKSEFVSVPEEEVTDGLTEEEQSYEAAKADQVSETLFSRTEFPQPETTGEISMPLVALEAKCVDSDIKTFYLEAVKLQEFAIERVIATAEDLKPATDDLSIIAKVKKALEEKWKGFVRPLQDHVKEINDAFKALMLPIGEADRITRDKILGFNKEQERIRQEQEEINRKRQEAAEAEMRLKGELSESVNLVEVAEEAPKRVSTEMGTTGQRMIKKWELVDMAQVPEEYKILDSARVTKVVKAGIPSIPGIRIYEEPIITVKAR